MSEDSSPRAARDTKLIVPLPIQEILRETISGVGGNEVYFLGRVFWADEGTDSLAVVDEIQIVARGNQSSVPAVLQECELWDLAIHNHPGGDLTPSDADIGVASVLAGRSVGFAIISNDAAQHYLVTPPFRPREAAPVDPDEIRGILGPGGLLSTADDGFEVREGQLQMALQVTRALNEDKVVAAEAGTGVGKSYAYLIPAILWAARNSDRVVVSTGTINLQEQLVTKDLPLLQKLLPVSFKYALIKGRGNYACLRKAEEVSKDLEQSQLFEEAEREALKALLAWIRMTSDGSRADLSWVPPADAWEHVMAETDKCLKVKCERYADCFYYAAKRLASSANIIVANHHLFFSDLSVRRATGNFSQEMVLPGYRRVIFDEAHHLEDVASEHLGLRFSRAGIRMRLSRIRSPRERGGTVPRIVRRLESLGDRVAASGVDAPFSVSLPEASARIEEAFLSIEEELARLPAAAGARASARGARLARYPAASGEGFGALAGQLEGAEPAPGRPFPDGGAGAAEAGETASAGEPDEVLQLRYKDDPDAAPFWDVVSSCLARVEEQLAILISAGDRAIQSLRASTLAEAELRGPLLELTAARNRLELLAGEMEMFRNFEDSSQVRWITRRPARYRSDEVNLEFGSAPIRVAEELKTLVYEPMSTVALTSATLFVGGGIEFLGDRLGLLALDPERFQSFQFPSPFDFERQVLMALPTDLPLPPTRGYLEEIPEAVFRLLEASQGRAFVLFTSYGLLRKTFEKLRGRLEAIGLRPVAQGDAGRSDLLSRFKSGVSNVLFGTDSFWEGVDVKGRALECVIITRLPFRVPSEPIQEARHEELGQRGLNPFTEFTVPQAVLKFKQGFGRLIRSSTDRGVVAVLDRRILTKPYGRKFLESLPRTTFVASPMADVVDRVKGFFRSSGAAPQPAPGPGERVPPGPAASSRSAPQASPGSSPHHCPAASPRDLLRPVQRDSSPDRAPPPPGRGHAPARRPPRARPPGGGRPPPWETSSSAELGAPREDPPEERRPSAERPPSVGRRSSPEHRPSPGRRPPQGRRPPPW